MDLPTDDTCLGPAGAATLERWFAGQGTPPRFDLARSGAASMTLGDLVERTGIGIHQLLATSLDYGPGEGSSGLRGAIRRSLHAPDGAEVVVTSGAVEAVLLLCIARRDRGHVLVGSPAYSGLLTAPAAAGCATRTVPVWSPVDGLHLDEITNAVSATTSLVVVNTPHNPSGRTAAACELEALAERCARHGALLVVDEVARATLDPGAPSAVHLRSFGSGAVVVLGDVSKSLGLGGLRIGWLCCADAGVCRSAAEAKDGTTVSSSTLSERLATIALDNTATLLDLVRSRARTNLAAVSSLVERHRAGAGWNAPSDGLVAFPAVPAPQGVNRLVQVLRESHVSAVPGSLFGEPDRLRLGIGARVDTFAEGLRRIESALA